MALQIFPLRNSDPPPAEDMSTHEYSFVCGVLHAVEHRIFMRHRQAPGSTTASLGIASLVLDSAMLQDMLKRLGLCISYRQANEMRHEQVPKARECGHFTVAGPQSGVVFSADNDDESYIHTVSAPGQESCTQLSATAKQLSYSSSFFAPKPPGLAPNAL